MPEVAGGCLLVLHTLYSEMPLTLKWGRGGRRSRGRVVTPGYIDNYSQSDSESNVSETPQLRQHGESDSANSSFGV